MSTARWSFKEDKNYIFDLCSDIFFFILSYTAGPNLDKKCIWLSDAAPSHEIFRKIYFVVKPYEKVL